MKKSQPVTILLIEDDELDVEATIRAFRKFRIANNVVVASNGEEGLDCLRGTNGKEQVSRPFLILLDLNMPRMNGHEFLEHLRADPELATSIVFVLTTSDAHKDQWQAYSKHIAGYIVKNSVGEDFVNLLDMIEHYWKVVELPVE